MVRGMLNALNVGLLEAWTHWPATSSYFWKDLEPARTQDDSQSKGKLQWYSERVGVTGGWGCPFHVHPAQRASKQITLLRYSVLELDKALCLLLGLPPAGHCSCLSGEPMALLRFLVEQGEEEETEKLYLEIGDSRSVQICGKVQHNSSLSFLPLG